MHLRLVDLINVRTYTIYCAGNLLRSFVNQVLIQYINLALCKNRNHIGPSRIDILAETLMELKTFTGAFLVGLIMHECKYKYSSGF